MIVTNKGPLGDVGLADDGGLRAHEVVGCLLLSLGPPYHPCHPPSPRHRLGGAGIREEAEAELRRQPTAYPEPLFSQTINLGERGSFF